MGAMRAIAARVADWRHPMSTTNLLAPPTVDSDETAEPAATSAPAPPSATRPATRRPRRAGHGVEPILGGLGALLPMACGIVLLQLAELVPAWALLLSLFAVGIVGGALLRVHSAPMLVAATFVAGAGASLWAQGALTGTVMLLLVVLSIPLAAGATGGVPLGVWLEGRLGRPAR
jgi:hypothetical protein